MPNIDDLSISVKSSVTSATNSIDKLITKLGALSASLGQVNTSGFSAMASGIRQITNATSGMGTVHAKDVAKTVKAINNFATIDAQNLNRVGSAIYSISNSISSINGLNANTENINKLALSIRQFGFTTATQASNNIPKISKALTRLVLSMKLVGSLNVNTQGLSNILSAVSRLGGAKVNTAITQIPLITDALRKLMTSLSKMNTLNINTAGLTQLVNAISRLGGKTVTQSISNIPKVTEAVMQMMATLSKAPQVSYNVIQLVNSLTNLASQGSKVGTASNSLYNGFMRFGAGADHARKKSFSLASAIGKLYASYFLLFRLFGSIGKAIDISSSLTEVENVVNVTFGKYRDLLDDFTETSLQQYGIGELDAKKFASRYQSMGVAMGFTQEEMAKMSVELTKLTGDYASFYDAALGDVHEDMLAIFTGQTRPLRAYGLDLTQATLQEWALSEGMQVNIQDMTQMEKTMLRYQYVMANSDHVMGDFLRTCDSWHNMMTVLNGTLKQFGATVGNVAINFLKPLVAWFNNAIVVVNEFAVSIMNALGKLFGWEYKYTPGGLTQDDADIVEDYGSALGGAADKAKKLKQQLQGFDELNVLTTNTPSSGGGGGGGSLDDYEYTQTDGLFNVKEIKETYESEIDSLYELGEYISTTISNGLRDIDWQEVYQGAKDFGTGLASFLNGLISPELFSATGSTIAGALNTAIYSTLAFGEKFDFKELGLSIAESINSFFRDTDFSSLGEDIKTWVTGLRTTLITIIKEVEWGEILSGIGDVLGSLDAETIITLFGFKALSMLFKRNLFSTLAGALSGVVALPASLTTGLASITSLIFKGFVGSLGAAFVGFKLGEWIYEQISGDETSDINYLDYFLGDSKASASEWWGAVKEYIKNDIVTIEDGGIADTIINSVTGKSAKEISSKRNREPSKKIKQLSKDISKYFGSSSKVVDLFAKDYSKDMEDVTSTTDTLRENVTSKYDNIKENAESSFNFVRDHILGTTTETTNSMTSSYNEASNSIKITTNQTAKGMANSYIEASNSIKITSSDTTSDIVAKYQAMRNNVSSSVTSMKNSVNASSNSIKVTSADTTSDIVAKYKAMRTSNVNEVTTMRSQAVAQLAKVKTDGINATNGLNTNLKAKFEDARLGANASFVGMHNIVVSNMNASRATIEGQSWYSSGSYLVGGLASGIADRWGSTSGSGLVGKIVSLASGLTSALKRAFGIHSPSKEWAVVGKYLTQGLEVGTLSEERHLNKSIIAMGSRLTDTMGGALTLATPSSLSSNFDFGVTSTMAHSYSADSSMSSSVADGVRQGLSASQMEQNALLREQNELLYQILQKEGISSDDVYNVVVAKNRDTFNRTGYSPLMA